MIFDFINICYNSTHRSIQVDGPVKVQNVNSQHQASKLIRAVLRGSGGIVEEWRKYSIHRCHCGRVEGNQDDEMDTLDSFLKLDDLGISDGDTLFIRSRVEGAEQREIEGNEGEQMCTSHRRRNKQVAWGKFKWERR